MKATKKIRRTMKTTREKKKKSIRMKNMMMKTILEKKKTIIQKTKQMLMTKIKMRRILVSTGVIVAGNERSEGGSSLRKSKKRKGSTPLKRCPSK